MNKEDILAGAEKKKAIARQCRNFVAVSESGEFFCMESHRNLGLYRTPAYLGSMVYVLAVIHKDGSIVGVSSGSGNKFDCLSEVEKMDCATIVVQLHNLGIVTLAPETEEQKLEKAVAGPTK